MGDKIGDNFGVSTSLSNDGLTVAIGIDGHDERGIDNGQVRIYDRIGLDWFQRGESVNGEESFNWSGYSIALSGNGSVLAVGESGANWFGNRKGQTRTFMWTI